MRANKQHKAFLISCFYDGFTLTDAVAIIERGGYDKVSGATIDATCAEIKDCTGFDWSVADSKMNAVDHALDEVLGR